MWHTDTPTRAGTPAASSCLGLRESQTKPVRANLLDYHPLPRREEARPWILKPTYSPFKQLSQALKPPPVWGKVLGQPLGKIFPPPTQALVQERAEGDRSH